MQNLFPDENNRPEGFSYFENFLTIEEEAELLETVQSQELHTLMFQGFEAKRKVASFGHDYSFDSRKLKKGLPIPEAFLPLVRRVASHLGINEKDFAELLITEYPPDAVINWHRDAPPFGLIAGVSLMSGCIFRLRPHGKENRDRSSVISLPVARRSLYVISGKALQDWEHSIRPVKQTRYSITLRTLREGAALTGHADN